MTLVGKVLSNRYEILEEIGVGGMATVYKAKCKLLNRYVAVKVLKEEYAKDENFERRFRVEAQSAASLTHPNIVSVFDVGKEDGINYIVMELLQGFTLKDYIDKEGVLSNDTTIKLALQIASALEAAHKAKIIHRDIKPQNIVLSQNMKEAKVTDFGIAKMTSSATITNFGSTLGSVHYFSPEHAKGGYTDEKSDIYSLGVVMYEMCTGKLPFNADTAVSVAIKQIQEEPKAPKEVNPRVSDELNSIILKAMQKNTADRYASATEMVEDLSRAMHGTYSKILKPKEDVSVDYSTAVIPIIGMRDIRESRKNSLEANKILARKKDVMDIDNEEIKIEVKQEEKETKKEIKEEAKEADIFGIDKRVASRKKKIILYSIIGASILALAVITFFIISIAGKVKDKNVAKELGAPELIGKVYETSKTEYALQGITINLDKYDFDQTLADGVIISQSIEKGKAMPSNNIDVIVSKGPKMVKMIDVVGKDNTVAKYEIEALGLIPEFEFVVNDKVLENIIISQSLAKDAEIKAGETVKIVVSKGNGKARVIVPNVMSMSESVATTTLQNLKFKVSVIYSQDTTMANDKVLNQSKKQNEEVEEGTLIELTINRLEKSKVVTVDIKDYIDEAVETTANLKVVAKVEGVTNTLKEVTILPPFAPIDVTVNGFTTANLSIYVNEKLVKDQTISF